MNAPGRLAYVLSRFPYLPETFTLREILGLERQGWQVEVCAIQHQRDPVTQPEARAVEARTHFLEPLSARTAAANLRLLHSSPVLYASLVSTVVSGNLGSRDFLLKALAIYPGAIALAERLRQGRVEHIHAQYGTHPALLALVAASILDIPFSFTVHAHDLFVDSTMLREKIGRAAFVAAISDFNRQRLIEIGGPATAAKIHVVRCGVDLDQYRVREHQVNPRQLSVLAVGSLQAYKGHEHLIRAIGLLRDRQQTGSALSVHCTVVGGGRLLEPLKALVASLQLSQHVTFAGYRNQHEVRAFMERADVLALPSVVASNGQMEGIPVVLMEAMAIGLPVVASRLSGIPELVQHGSTGLLVSPADPAALCDALCQIVASPTETLNRARNARSLVEQEYNLESNVRQLSGLLSGDAHRSSSRASAPMTVA